MVYFGDKKAKLGRETTTSKGEVGIYSVEDRIVDGMM